VKAPIAPLAGEPAGLGEGFGALQGEHFVVGSHHAIVCRLQVLESGSNMRE
jgi:hypothetical protein